MKITTIINDIGNNCQLNNEHGLSFLIEKDDKKILLDGGKTKKALDNFISLGFKTEDIDSIVLSHNHNDHADGLEFFIDKCTANIYLSQNYNKELHAKSCEERIDNSILFNKYADRLKLVGDQLKLYDDVYLCSVEYPLLALMPEDNNLINDDFSHEIYLAIMENGVLSILSSCSHKGIINILTDAKKRFDITPTNFIGGLHLAHYVFTEKEPIYPKTIKNILALQFPNTNIFTCHCTGMPAYNYLKSHLKNISYLSSGDVINV